MLKALLRKNWETKEGFGGSVYLTIAAMSFLLSLIDWKFSSPSEFVYSFFVVAALLMGIIGAVSGFGNDRRNNCGQFVDYLPIRRWERWLGNSIPGFAFGLIVLTALTWRRIFLFTPFRDDFVAAYFLPNGWALAAIVFTIYLSAFAFFSYFCVSFVQIHAQQELHNILGVLGAIPLMILPFVGVGVFLEESQILPAALDFAGLLAPYIAPFLLAGFCLYCFLPKHMTPWKRDLFIQIPICLLIIAVMAAQFYFSCHRWKQFSFDLPFNILETRPVASADGSPVLAVDVYSPRSDSHLFSVNVDTAETHSLGREFRIADRDRKDRKIDLVSTRGPEGLLRDDQYFTEMSIDGAESRRLLKTGDNPYKFNYSKYRYSLADTVKRVPGGGLICAELYNDSERELSGTNLVFTDANGKTRAKFPIYSSGATFLTSKTKDRVLAIAAPKKDEPDDTDGYGYGYGYGGYQYAYGYGDVVAKEGEPYMLIDTKSLSVKRFNLPGPILARSPGLDQVACPVWRIDGDVERRSIVIVDIPCLEERVLIPEDQLPEAKIKERVAAAKASLAIGPDRSWRAGSIHFNQQFTKAILMRKQVERDFFAHSLELIDVATGATSTLIPPNELPKYPVMLDTGNPAIGLTFSRFTPDGDAIIYYIGDKVFSRDLSTGGVQLLADLALPEEENERGEDENKRDYGDSRYSPNDLRLYRRIKVYPPGYDPQSHSHPRPKPLYSYFELIDKGEKRTVYSTERTVNDHYWLDNDRLAITEPDKALIVPVDDGEPRQIFPRLDEEVYHRANREASAAAATAMDTI